MSAEEKTKEYIDKLKQGIDLTHQQFIGALAVQYDKIITPFNQIIQVMALENKKLQEEINALRKQLGEKPPIKGNRKQRRAAAKNAKTS